MKENLRIAILFTLVTTIIFGLLYPLGVTGLARAGKTPHKRRGWLTARRAPKRSGF